MAQPDGTARQRFGDHLRERRTALGLHAKQVAKDLKVDPAQVSRWESGAQIPHPKRIEAIAGVLKVDPLKLALLLVTAASEDNAQLSRDKERLEQERRAIHQRLDAIEAKLGQLLEIFSEEERSSAESESEGPVEVGFDRG